MGQIKEKIKLKTEWMRGFFVLFVMDTTSIATLLIRQRFLKNEFEYDLLILVVVVDIILITIIFVFNKKINNLINLLEL